MNKKLRPLLLLMLPALASCGGFSLNYIVEGNKYISANFNDNYYEHWDAELKNAEHVQTFTETDTQFIESFNDIGTIDANLLVNNPYAGKSGYDFEDTFGADYRLNRTSEIFNYGVQSKLFDGITWCGGRHQRVRVQARKNGFSVRLSKESDTVKYFAMNYKSTTNNQIRCYSHITGNISTSDGDKFHASTIDLTVTLYCKSEVNKIVGYDFKKEVSFPHTNDGDYYYFHGFKTEDIGTENFTISRLVGFSVTFDVTHDELIEYNASKTDVELTDNDYALFIYEVFMPYTYWH